MPALALDANGRFLTMQQLVKDGWMDRHGFIAMDDRIMMVNGVPVEQMSDTDIENTFFKEAVTLPLIMTHFS